MADKRKPEWLGFASPTAQGKAKTTMWVAFGMAALLAWNWYQMSRPRTAAPTKPAPQKIEGKAP